MAHYTPPHTHTNTHINTEFSHTQDKHMLTTHKHGVISWGANHSSVFVISHNVCS